jgi:6-phosphofructokinase 1
MQRGMAPPSCFDRVPLLIGVKAVESLTAKKSNFMVGMINDKAALTPLLQAIKRQNRNHRLFVFEITVNQAVKNK